MCVSLCSSLETNTPYYYSECVRVLGPVLEQGWDKTKAATVLLSDHTLQLITWIRENTPLLIEWVKDTHTHTYIQTHAHMKLNVV